MVRGAAPGLNRQPRVLLRECLTVGAACAPGQFSNASPERVKAALAAVLTLLTEALRVDAEPVAISCVILACSSWCSG